MCTHHGYTWRLEAGPSREQHSVRQGPGGGAGRRPGAWTTGWESPCSSVLNSPAGREDSVAVPAASRGQTTCLGQGRIWTLNWRSTKSSEAQKAAAILEPSHLAVNATMPARHSPEGGITADRPRRGTATLLETGAGWKPAYTESLPRTPQAAGAARRLTSTALHSWGLAHLESAGLLVTAELMSNAVIHAQRETVRVTVTRLNQRRVRIAVVDLSRELPRFCTAGTDAESGRGLTIVDALSGGRWGVDPLHFGKRVWADVEETHGE
ncbi:ATP-binding protein [Streptomyces sp. NBC_00876]|uniref:ATP-binding protein n=1 Tax=Streptomyces sp. NBC_00876 TaxID=2975853 RepID=UPI003865AC41